jgi:hypothetical protein
VGVVVDHDPPAVVEAQQQVCAGDGRVRNSYIGVQVTADDHVAARGEVGFRPMRPNRQHRLRRAVHRRLSRIFHQTIAL